MRRVLNDKQLRAAWDGVRRGEPDDTTVPYLPMAAFHDYFRSFFNAEDVSTTRHTRTLEVSTDYLLQVGKDVYLDMRTFKRYNWIYCTNL
jgi:hypothetical protein